MRGHEWHKHGIDSRYVLTCGVGGCKYRSPLQTNMQNHKWHKHGETPPTKKRRLNTYAQGERDKWGRIVVACGVAGCFYKIGAATMLKRHKLAKHGINCWKNDGKERDAQGAIVRVCGIDGCTFKTGSTVSMKTHKASKHGIEAVWKNDDGKERDKRGSIIRMCGISGCTYKTENSTNLKNHKASKHGIEAVDGKDRSASTT